MVRLVCLLVQSILSKDGSALQPLLVELQTFCLAFPRVKEATSLYRAIKSLEAGK
jgi:hypothetical protein